MCVASRSSGNQQNESRNHRSWLELLTPDRLDTNSLFLTEELNAIGIEVVRKTVVGDNRDLLAEAFRDALNRVPLIVSSGGLGPTQDDLTPETGPNLLRPKLRPNAPLL